MDGVAIDHLLGAWQETVADLWCKKQKKVVVLKLVKLMERILATTLIKSQEARLFAHRV